MAAGGKVILLLLVFQEECLFASSKLGQRGRPVGLMPRGLLASYLFKEIFNLIVHLATPAWRSYDNF